MIHKLLGYTPKIGEGTFVAPGTHLVGQVTVGRDCSIWYGSVLRGDVGPITIGNETNIQDGTVIHGTFNRAFTTLGNRVTVGHSVVLHGCKVDDLCLVGMGCILMDNVHIGPRNIIGAGSLITENTKFLEEGWLILGRPAKAVRKLTAEEVAFLDKSADNYLRYKSWYQGGQP